jgi:hypothetical protein
MVIDAGVTGAVTLSLPLHAPNMTVAIAATASGRAQFSDLAKTATDFL